MSSQTNFLLRMSFAVRDQTRYTVYRQYYKRKLELKSNSIEIMAVNCTIICDSTATYTDKTQTWSP